MATSEFRYLPLDTQNPSFRLLRLRKGDTVKIECDIFHRPIHSSDTTYEALSYTWGSTDVVDHVQIDGRRLWITANLYSALLCLRSSEYDRNLWIDAICIDQSSKTERSQQVQMMGNIFGSAEKVIFWLEKPTPEVVLLMESLSELQIRSIALLGDNTNDEKTLRKLWSQLTLESHDDDVLSRQRKGLLLLLKRSWFERIWILQEVANSQSAVVCSGTLSIPAHVFALSPSLLDINPSPHIQSVLDIMPQASRRDSWWIRERELSDLLNRFRASKATDKRDMIFALLGMSSEPDHRLLRPDYTMPIQEVLHNAVRYWFESTDIPISQVIHLLAAFETVGITYLVLPNWTATAGEMVQTLSRTEIIECVRDASLLTLEQNEEDTSKDRYTFHDELHRLQNYSKLENGPYSSALRIVPWQNSQQNIKFLIVSDVERALLMSSWMQTLQVFDFIMSEGTKNDQGLLDRTLLETQEHDYWGKDRRENLYRTIKLLIDRGADVNAQGGELGNTLQGASLHGHEDLVQMLLGRGADVNVQGGNYGNALQAASFHGRDKIVQMLLERGANVNAQGGLHSNALQAASYRGSERIVQMLLDNGADVNAQGGYEGTALRAASYHGHDRIVQMLLNKGADVNAQGGYDGTALEAASYRGSDKIVQILLDNGADVNAQGGNYGSALQTAAYHGHDRIVQILLENGADVNAQGGFYGTALQAALLSPRNEKVVQVLRSFEASTKK